MQVAHLEQIMFWLFLAGNALYYLVGIVFAFLFQDNRAFCKYLVNMFYKQIILQRGLPFEVKIPSARPVDISTLSEAEFNEELEKGYADMQAGRTKNAKKAFADIRKDYGLSLIHI